MKGEREGGGGGGRDTNFLIPQRCLALFRCPMDYLLCTVCEQQTERKPYIVPHKQV